MAAGAGRPEGAAGRALILYALGNVSGSRPSRISKARSVLPGRGGHAAAACRGCQAGSTTAQDREHFVPVPPTLAGMRFFVITARRWSSHLMSFARRRESCCTSLRVCCTASPSLDWRAAMDRYRQAISILADPRPRRRWADQPGLLPADPADARWQRPPPLCAKCWPSQRPPAIRSWNCGRCRHSPTWSCAA